MSTTLTKRIGLFQDGETLWKKIHKKKDAYSVSQTIFVQFLVWTIRKLKFFLESPVFYAYISIFDLKKLGSMFLSHRNQPTWRANQLIGFHIIGILIPNEFMKNTSSDLKPLTVISSHLVLSFTLKIRYIHFPSFC